jgi:hypothetical protein
VENEPLTLLPTGTACCCVRGGVVRGSPLDDVPVVLGFLLFLVPVLKPRWMTLAANLDPNRWRNIFPAVEELCCGVEGLQ